MKSRYFIFLKMSNGVNAATLRLPLKKKDFAFIKKCLSLTPVYTNSGTYLEVSSDDHLGVEFFLEYYYEQ